MSESNKAPDSEHPPLNGRVHKGRKKSELQDIAEALGLDSTGVVETLVARIKPYLASQTATLSQVPRFSGLYTFKPTRKATKKTEKTSADKAAEDDSEKAKSLTLTAYAIYIQTTDLKLQELKVTTDPPGSFAPLSLQKNTSHEVVHDEDPKSSSDEDGSSSPLTSSSVVGSDSQWDLVDTGDKKGKKKKKKAESALEKEKQDIPNVSHETKPVLMKLLSVNGPAQDVYVPELEAGSTVAQHMQGSKIKALDFEPANIFNLQPTSQGYYTGDIIYEAPSAPDGTIQKPEGSGLAIGATHLTGSGSDKPLEIAREREKYDIFKNPELMKEFYASLRAHADVDLKTYPAGPVDDMEEALKQHLAYETVLEEFKPWLKKKKGYHAEKFHGQDFTKTQITTALGLKSSTIGNINKYFDHERLLHTPDALEWFTSKGKKRLDANHQAAIRRNSKRRRSSTPSSSDSGEDSSDDSSDGGHARRKAKKTKLAKKSEKQAKKKSAKPDSNNLD
ncbi:hypothetical protein B0H17DRAFT_1216378 [Mycena rosella]|uniref:SAP domain-containing protein n=1 Tax=Mycena rosella TaxID=1033263 RepID=A0AAD7FXI6_MYCRO|nr:hypothetical protein B0H17DRAFT_1216378 [Mycena rosella]